MGEKPDVGILFVHGIGEQQRGDTLGIWGDAVTDWLRGWCGDENVAVHGAHLTGDDDDPSAPAYLDLTVSLRQPETGESATARWRLAEAWWAQAFQPPRFRELAAWAFDVLPYAVIAHFVARFQRDWAGSGNGVLAAGWRIVALTLRSLEVLVAVLLAPLLAVLVLVMLLLGAMPVARLRQAAAVVQRTLSRSVGDSFVLLGSTTRAAAIVHRVEHDLRWLAEGCEQLVVVAHSQGAAVAHRALRVSGLPNIARFITLGSGQTKLAALEGIRRSGAHRVVWMAPAGLLLVAVSVAMAVDQLRGEEGEVFAVIVGLVYGLGFFVFGAVEARTPEAPVPDELSVGASEGWLDLWATHDPVSNGPVFGIRSHNKVVTSRPVTNLGSTARDHMTYARNGEQVLSTIARAAAEACERTIDQTGVLDQAVTVLAGARREWRVALLRRLRLLVALALVALLAVTADRWPAVGAAIVAGVARVLDALPFVALDVDAFVPEELSPWVGAMSVVACVTAGYAVLAAVWRIWDRHEAERMHARIGYPLWAGELVVLGWLTGGLLVTATIALGWLRAPLNAERILTPEAALIPVGLAVLYTILAMIVALVAWPLRQVGLIRPGHYPPSPGETSAILGPAAVAILALAALEPPDGTPFLVGVLLLVFGAPVLALLGPALLSSSRRIHSMLQPLRARARAGPVPLATWDLMDDRAEEVLRSYAAGLTRRITRHVELGQLEETLTGRRARLLDDLANEAVQIAQRLGQDDLAAELLAAAAPVNVDAALQLAALRPDWPQLQAWLGDHAHSATWHERRQLRALPAGTAASPTDDLPA